MVGTGRCQRWHIANEPRCTPLTPHPKPPNPSLEEMDTRMMEVLVFVDGIDAMTSKQMQVGTADV